MFHSRQEKGGVSVAEASKKVRDFIAARNSTRHPDRNFPAGENTGTEMDFGKKRSHL
jgi:hypothetical protein